MYIIKTKSGLRYPLLSLLLAAGIIALFLLPGCAALEKERAKELAVTPRAAIRQCDWAARRYNDGWDQYTGLIKCDGAKPINNCKCLIVKE